MSCRVVGCELEMHPQLALEIGITPARPETAPETDEPLANGRHDRVLRFYASSRSSVCMIVTIRAHSAFSVVS
jgi:hypothetical protein